MRIRADFTKAGWSLERDLGRRLRYADAISLHEAMSCDPATYTGAKAIGLAFPRTAAAFTILQAIGAHKLVGTGTDGEPADGQAEKPTPTEIREAVAHESALFNM